MPPRFRTVNGTIGFVLCCEQYPGWRSACAWKARAEGGRRRLFSTLRCAYPRIKVRNARSVPPKVPPRLAFLLVEKACKGISCAFPEFRHPAPKLSGVDSAPPERAVSIERWKQIVRDAMNIRRDTSGRLRQKCPRSKCACFVHEWRYLRWR